MRRVWASLAVWACAMAAAQPSDRAAVERHAEPIPPEIAVDALIHAYSTRTVAEEVRLKVRLPGDIERTEFFVIRIQPGPDAAAGPSRLFLDFGPLKVLGADGSLTAISAAAPGKYARTPVEGPLGVGGLFGFIPPIAVPQLVLASGKAEAFSAPTPFTPGIRWTSASADDSVRPPVVTVSGSGPSGTVTLTANAETGRLLGLRAVVQGRGGETVLEMAIRAVEPGDPTQWALRTEGRARVAGVSDLRPSPAPRPATAEDFTATFSDGTAWTLHGALPPGGTKPLAMVLIRAGAEDPASPARIADAQRGAAAIRSVIRGSPDAVPPIAGIELSAAAVFVVDAATFKAEEFGEQERRWLESAQPGERAERPMWTPGGGAILGKAGAVIAVVHGDRTVHAVIPLDDRTDPAPITDELRAALTRPARKETATPEAPR